MEIRARHIAVLGKHVKTEAFDAGLLISLRMILRKINPFPPTVSVYRTLEPLLINLYGLFLQIRCKESGKGFDDKLNKEFQAILACGALPTKKGKFKI